MPHPKYRTKYTNYKRKNYNIGRKYRGFLSTTAQTAITANMAMKTAKTAMSLLNVELKHFDTGTTIYPNDTGFGQVSFMRVPQGDTDETRDGEKIRVKSFNLLLEAIKHATPAQTILKLALVKCSQVHTDTDPSTHVYEDNALLRQRNMDFTKKYKVIWTKFVNLTSINPKKIINQFIKLDVPISYTTADGDSIEANGYYLIATSDAPAATKPTLVVRSRTRYLDN